MSRGARYTEEENARLMKLFEDFKDINPKMTNIELAQKAITYGICNPERNANSVAQQISRLIMQSMKIKDESYEEDDDKCNDDEPYKNMDIFDYLELEDVKKDRDTYKNLYESLLGTILSTSHLENGKLHICFPAIINWLNTHESKRVAIRIENLQNGDY